MENRIERLNDEADAAESVAWLRRVAKAIGPGFHPDTPATDYILGATDEPLFDAEEAACLDADLDRAFKLLEAAGRDPYVVAARVQRRLLGMPAPE